jgi:hypothetical protein
MFVHDIAVIAFKMNEVALHHKLWFTKTHEAVTNDHCDGGMTMIAPRLPEFRNYTTRSRYVLSSNEKYAIHHCTQDEEAGKRKSNFVRITKETHTVKYIMSPERQNTMQSRT